MLVEKFLSDSLLLNKVFVLLGVILLAVDQISAKSIRIVAFLQTSYPLSLGREQVSRVYSGSTLRVTFQPTGRLANPSLL